MNTYDALAFLKRALRRGLVDGAILTATTSSALMLMSKSECGSPWSAINPISHMIDGDDKVYGDSLDVRDTGIGLALNSSAMLAWGVLHAGAFGKHRGGKSMAAGIATAIAAYAIDYHLVPKRFTPGIEKKISPAAILFCYVVLALTLGICGAARSPET